MYSIFALSKSVVVSALCIPPQREEGSINPPFSFNPAENPGVPSTGS